MDIDVEWYKVLESGKYPVLRCPGCGHTPLRDNLRDSLHPTRREPDCLWEFGCLTCEGGCDNYTSYGRSAKEAVDRWNYMSQHPREANVLIERQLVKQLRNSLHGWASQAEDLAKKLKDQVAITDSLKRDLAALQGRTIQPCPASSEMGEFACKNQHECWEPCGVMGNDERFAVVVDNSRIQDCALTFKGAKITSTGTPKTLDQIALVPEPLMLPLVPTPGHRRLQYKRDTGDRRRKSD